MSDRSDIEAVLLGYCSHVDAADVAGVVALFARDGGVEMGSEPITGHATLTEFYGERVLRTYAATSHHLTNVAIRLATPQAASASSAVIAWHQRVDGRQFVLWGRYADQLVREDGIWRIGLRSIRVAGSTDLGMDRSLPVPFPHIDRHSLEQNE